MALQDIVVPGPDQWRWHGLSGVDGAYQLISPTGSIAGTWWPEAQPSGMYELLRELALTLNDREPSECPLCRGDAARGQLCSGCLADHRAVPS